MSIHSIWIMMLLMENVYLCWIVFDWHIHLGEVFISYFLSRFIGIPQKIKKNTWQQDFIMYFTVDSILDT